MDNEVRQMLDDMRNKEEWWKSTIRWIISFSALVLTARMIAEGALWMSDLDIYPFFFLYRPYRRFLLYFREMKIKKITRKILFSSSLESRSRSSMFSKN